MGSKRIMFRCELLELLQDASAASTSELHRQLGEAFETFVLRLERTARRADSRIDLLRLYARLRSAFKRRRIDAPTAEQGYCIEAALEHLETERRLLLLELRYPTLATSRQPKFSSLICWSGAFTPTDLMELITALHAVGAVRRIDGGSVEMRSLVRAFEQFLNISIRNPERCRYAAVNRKLSLTKFLDTLRDALVELSRK